MHIVHIIDHLGPGGAQRLLFDVASRQICDTVSVTVICLKNRTVLCHQLELSGVRVLCLNLPKWSVRQVYAVVDCLSQLKPEIIHTHLVRASVLGRIGAYITKAPLLIHDHEASSEIDVLPGPILAMKRLIEPYAPPAALRYVAVSQSTADYARDVRRLPSSKLVVVPNGIDVARFVGFSMQQQEARAQYHLPRDAQVVGFAGRLAHVKGIDILVEMMSQLPPNVYLILLGSGPQKAWLEECADAAGVSERLRFLGQLNDVRPALRACDVYVQPSRREPFGLAAAEAALLGLPVVAAAVGGLREVVLDGTTGLLVAPESARDLAHAVMSLLQAPQKAADMGMHGRAYVADAFSINRVVAQLSGIYSDLLIHRPSPSTQRSGVSGLPYPNQGLEP